MLNKRVIVDEKFDRDFPEYPDIDRIADSWYTRIAFGVLYTAFYWQFATHWWMFLFLPIQNIITPNFY